MRILTLALVLSLVSGTSALAAETEKAEKAIAEMLKIFTDLETDLAKIEDKEDAEKHLPGLKKMAARLAALRDTTEKLKLSKEEEESLFKKFEDKLVNAGVGVGKQVRRLEKVEPAQECLAVVKKMLESLGTEPKKAEPKKK